MVGEAIACSMRSGFATVAMITSIAVNLSLDRSVSAVTVTRITPAMMIATLSGCFFTIVEVTGVSPESLITRATASVGGDRYPVAHTSTRAIWWPSRGLGGSGLWG